MYSGLADQHDASFSSEGNKTNVCFKVLLLMLCYLSLSGKEEGVELDPVVEPLQVRRAESSPTRFR